MGAGTGDGSRGRSRAPLLATLLLLLLLLLPPPPPSVAEASQQSRIQGIIDAGMGESQLNSLFSSIDVPAIPSSTLKRYERKVGPAIESIAEESCIQSVRLEKELEMKNLQEQSQLDKSAIRECNEMNEVNATMNEVSDALSNSCKVFLKASYDSGWQKRGTGHSYNSLSGPSSDFSAHRIVRPRVYHGRNKREISSTRESDTDHTDVLSVGLEFDGVPRILDLRLNQDLVPIGYKERHQHQGAFKTHEPSKVELCHYQGSIREIPGSWAAVSTCRGLKGVVFDGETLHHIQPEEETLQSAHYVYKHTDLIANRTCGYKGTPEHIADEFIGLQKASGASRHKRATETIRGPYNANRQSRYVELVLVIDKNEYTNLGENLTRVHHHCKDIANIINALYTPLNIFIALVGVEVWTDADEIPLVSNGDTTLNNFLRYRRENLVKTIPNDNAQLLTKMHFDEGVVGKALKGPICTYEFSGGVSVEHSNVVGLVAATVAHEMGHNFGMEHDSMECVCPEDRCIMAPSSGHSWPTHWSSCSLQYLALAFEHGMDYCLRNKPKRLFDSPVCGNGFVEPGEQCDCGLLENCDNPCCDAATCMLHVNASCATGECCDLKTCKPKSAGAECRSAEQECDLPEFCTGQSEYCPPDVFKIDGEACSTGKAYCYQGSCRTHNDQCQLLWGPTASTSDELCYAMNSRGTKNGNCGYNRTGNNYIKCHEQNNLCGMLHCKHLNERLEFGMESVATLSHSFLNSQGNIIACRSAIVDLGLNQVDPGLAPDGARCAPGKMCVNQRCMPVAELRTAFPGGKACPSNCSGNGVCNSLGHCHCNRGFQPPDCTQPGVGGSEDSGPAEDPNARSEYVMSLYIIFLGIVPTIAIISFGVWYSHNNGGGIQQWKKTSSGPMSTLSRGFGFHDSHHHHSHRHSSNSNGLTSSIKTIDRSANAGIDTIDSSLSITAQQDPACASLLPKKDPDERFNNNFFGQFKGFSISPISQNIVKTENSPPTTATSTSAWNTINSTAIIVPIKTNVKPIRRSNTLRQTPSVVQSAPIVPPALPPPNAGSTARPLISSPVLATTTCTSMELIAAKVPTRPAPDIPSQVQQEKPTRPISSQPDNSVNELTEKRPGSAEKSVPSSSNTSTLTRIASMLYPISGIVKSNLGSGSEKAPVRYNTNSLPRSHHHKANKVLDKEILRTLEISNPIPQQEIEILGATIPVKPDTSGPKTKTVVMRAQSMRDSKVTPRPAIHSFGSMRHPQGVDRPTSIPTRVRPSSPPPGPPVKAVTVKEPLSVKEQKKIPDLSGSKNAPVKLSSKLPQTDNAYDDCMNLVPDASLGKIMEESPSSDNIYAVIEESIPEKVKIKNAALISNINVSSEYKTPRNIEISANSSAISSSSSGSGSMGLLSEIVSEISNRNLDSIYSIKTLNSGSKQPTELKKFSKDSTYANTDSSQYYKSPSSIYSKSTISSGYLHPSTVKVPTITTKISTEQNSSQKSLVSENASKLTYKSVSKPSENLVNAKPSLNRTKTPPGLSKVQKPVKNTTNETISLPKPVSTQNSDSSLQDVKEDTVGIPTKDVKINNSPDLVSSCSNQTNKSPDVLGRDNKLSKLTTTNKTSMVPRQQKSVMAPPKSSSLLSKTQSFSEKGSKTSPTSMKTISAGQVKSAVVPAKSEANSTSRASNGKSNVASLQQKFEHQEQKPATGTLTKKKPTATVAKK